MRFLIIGLLLTSCAVDVNLKQKTPIIIETKTEGEVTGKVEITMEMDIASQIEKICKDMQSDALSECSDKVINIYESLIKLVEMINQNKGGI